MAIIFAKGVVMNNAYTFSIYNRFAENGIFEALNVFNKNKNRPVIVCVGSDLVLGDSLGPLVGSNLKAMGSNCYVYGTLNAPITAKEIEYLNLYFESVHKNGILIAVDAAVGDKEEVGLIKVVNKSLSPGLGVNKKLDSIGQISILGVVAQKSTNNYHLYNTTRLGMVYKMANIIANGVFDYLKHFDAQIAQIKVDNAR